MGSPQGWCVSGNPVTAPTLSAVTLGVLLLGGGPSAVQRARQGGAVLGRDLLVEVVHLPPGQPGALGAGSASVLAAGFHLRIKSGKNKLLKVISLG